MTIKSRISILRVAGSATASFHAGKMYNETADVLEALERAYSDLFEACEAGIQEGDWSQARAHVRLIQAEKAKQATGKAGAA